MHDVHLSHVSPAPVAVVRRLAHASELATIVPQCCGLVWEFVRAHDLKGGRNIAIYWDGSIRLEVGVELDQHFAEAGEVVRSTTPGGLTASVVHFGPYHKLGAAHAAIRDWCAAHNHQFAGPSWELYGHWQKEWNNDPSQIRTDVFYQLVGQSP